MHFSDRPKSQFRGILGSSEYFAPTGRMIPMLAARTETGDSWLFLMVSGARSRRFPLATNQAPSQSSLGPPSDPIYASSQSPALGSRCAKGR